MSIRVSGVVLLFIAILHTTFVRADIFRWDNGRVIPGTEGIEPGPSVQLDHRELGYANLRSQNLTDSNFSFSNLANASLVQSTLSNANLTGAMVTGTTFSATTRRGFTKDQLYSTQSYQEKNLRGIGLGQNDLAGWDFSGQDMANATFWGCPFGDCGGSTLTNANLTGANLANADLHRSTLTNANLTGAVVTDTSFYDTTSRGFTKDQLYSTHSYQEKNLRGIGIWINDLSGWDFAGQDLASANLEGSTLTDANLTGAVVTRASFYNTTSRGFTKDQLYSTQSYQEKNLRGIQLGSNDLTDWNFAGQDLANAGLGDLTNANLTVANLANANLGNLTNANLTGAVVTGTVFGGGITKEQLYSTQSYQEKNLRGIAICCKDLTGWDFAAQDLATASLNKSILTSANFTGANLANAHLSLSTLTNANLTGANLTGAVVTGTLENANLSGTNLKNALLGNGLDSAIFSAETVYNQWTTMLDEFDPVIHGLTFIPSAPGDLDGTDGLTVSDVELLGKKILDKNFMSWQFAMFDLKRNRSIDANDLRTWVVDLKKTWFGDANVDGQFNSGDLVQVFQAGQYEDDQSFNSTWSTGDWNADGDFTTSDLIVAFQDEGYEDGPRAGVAAVPEPASWLMLIWGWLSLGILRRRKVTSAGGTSCETTDGKGQTLRTIHFYRSNLMTNSFANHGLRGVLMSGALAFCLASTGNSLAGTAFFDDFEDGNHADGNPVTWSRYPGPYFDRGDVSVQNGSLVVTPPPPDDGPNVFPNYFETDVVVENQLYHDVNIHTQFRALETSFSGNGGICALDTYISEGLQGSSVCGWLLTRGSFDTVIEIVAYQDILLNSWTRVSSQPTTLTHLEDDINLRLVVQGKKVSFKAWPEGDPEPLEPQLSSDLPEYLWDQVGRVVLWAGNDFTSFPVAFRFANVVPILVGDFNTNGSLDAADLDLLAGGMIARVAKFDLDGDADADLADRLKWVNELKRTWMGDADLNGEFNTGDMVAVFTAGKYETATAATWSEGDWNGDKLFSSGDMVTAFQGGGYEAGPRGGVAAVPEPASWMMLIWGWFSLGILRRRKVASAGGTSFESRRFGFRAHRRVRRAVRGEEFEPRYCLSAVAFAAHDIECCSGAGANSVYAADMDGDGDVDVLSASGNSFVGKIAWYENSDGQGTFGAERLITTKVIEASSVYGVDVDGDGDVDVLSASRHDNKIAWYENADGQGTFGDQRVITTKAKGASSVNAADVDGDGDVDVLSASTGDSKIAWYENTDGQGTFGNQRVITTLAANSVYAADMDGDGDVDVLSASAGDSKIAWYENTDGQGTFGNQNVITTLAANSVYAADMDGDGDVDVLSASTRHSKIAWYENTDGRGTFGDQLVITRKANGALSVYAADVDGDGDVDVLWAWGRFDAGIAWNENTDGRGTFGKQRVITTAVYRAYSAYATDVDGDGDVDVLSASSYDRDKIAWYENSDGRGTFGAQSLITTAADGAQSVYVADVDRDGDADVLSASDSGIAWYENTDGKGTFGNSRVITTDGANTVYAADVDGDGDVDVLSASIYDGIAWYENTDGRGTFGNQRDIFTEPDVAFSVYATDVDGDGDVDVLSASGRFLDGTIAWYENTDGKGTFGNQRAIGTERFFGAQSVYAADMDGDGDVDVLSASTSDKSSSLKIAWYENTDGKGTFGDQRVITAGRLVGSGAVYVADVDGDGDVDVLSASFRFPNDGTIAWHENTDGKGTFGNQRVITTKAVWARSVYASDVDGDGDVDVLSASSRDSKIAWYENTNGQGTFGNQRVISTEALQPSAVYTADVDGDGDVDVLSASYGDGRIAWYEQRLAGDANDDGLFNSSDLLLVFQAGKYEDGLARNATFAAGDWNGDQEFDSADLVLAFQFGHYQPAAQAGKSDIAVAVDRLFANVDASHFSRSSRAFVS